MIIFVKTFISTRIKRLSVLKTLRFLKFHEKDYVLTHNSCYQLGGPIIPIIDCPNPQWIGDGICDDPNNIFECDYDGGDCCGSNVNTQFCNDCLCPNKNLTAKGTGSHISSFMKTNSHGT